MSLIKKIEMEIDYLIHSTKLLHNTYKTMTTTNDITMTIEFDDALLYGLNNFGILNLTSASGTPTAKPQHILYMLDKSGSMSTMDNKGHSRLFYIIQTLRNMLKLFSETADVEIYVTVMLFDESVSTVMENIKVGADNIETLLAQADGIANGSHGNSTDIEIALKFARATLESVRFKHPEYENHNVFMTDGDANVGCFDVKGLRELIDYENTNNVFIGFGADHNSRLLSGISNNSYYFIDNIEKAGLVYGEIVHGILYKSFTGVEITVENGQIYNWVDNTWSNKLSVGNLVGGMTKTYHLNTDDTSVLTVTVTSKTDDVEFNSATVTNASLTSYMYRQRACELMFAATNVYDLGGDDLKNKMKLLMDEMQAYMSNCTDEMENKMVKRLCDDLYVSYMTLGTARGHMYTLSRQASQGLQRCYTVNHSQEDENDDYPTTPTMGGLSRQPTRCANDDVNDDDAMPMPTYRSSGLGRQATPAIPRLRRQTNMPAAAFQNYMVTDQLDDAPYSTPQCLKMMRAVSSAHTDTSSYAQSPAREELEEGEIEE